MGAARREESDSGILSHSQSDEERRPFGRADAPRARRSVGRSRLPTALEPASACGGQGSHGRSPPRKSSGEGHAAPGAAARAAAPARVRRPAAARSQPAARGLSNGDRAAALGPWPRPQRPAGPRERVVPDRATATACGARRRTRSSSRSLVVSRERRWRESLTRRRGAHSRARVNQGGPRPPWTPPDASGVRLRRGAARQGACGATEGVCIFCDHPTRDAPTLGRAKDRRRCAPLGKIVRSREVLVSAWGGPAQAIRLTH